MLRKMIRFSSRKVELNQFLRKMFDGSHSQYGEDLIIDKLLNHKPFGFYVDVGASHPIKFNNTYMFYMRGWNGINIDPNPSSKQAFDVLRSRDINYTLGIANKTASMPFYVINESMYSTFSKEEANESVLGGRKVEEVINVKVKKLKDVLNKINPETIDFMSIDTEGYDYEVLQSNDWNKYKPTVLCVECHNDSDKINKFLERKGYKRVHKATNNIFVLEGR